VEKTSFVLTTCLLLQCGKIFGGVAGCCLYRIWKVDEGDDDEENDGPRGAYYAN